MKLRYLAIVALPLILAACTNGETASTDTSGTEQIASSDQIKRWYKFEHVSAGAKVFKENCVACHGSQGQGADGWRKIGSDGKYPPPPLNGTGHSWHHPLNMLFYTVKNGSPGGQGNMPAWGEKLTEQEIVAAIAWFQSKWPDEIYEAWARRDMKSRQKG